MTLKPRDYYTAQVVESKSEKKLIVAGPGTGKTWTFRAVFDNASGKKLALTFIRRLVEDMDSELPEDIEVKTFHEYCKGLLHQNRSSFTLEPFLTQIIQKDSELLGLKLSDFDSIFQLLDETQPEIPFYLSRGDYYRCVSFSDSVYRILKLAEQKPGIIPKYGQVVVDEYQDFNPLEVKFIELISKNNSILVAGDDDQAIYAGRSASPIHIRNLFNSEEYTGFDLPWCGRCTSAIVESTNHFIEQAIDHGNLQERIPKEYQSHSSKEDDSELNPQIHFSECTTISTVAKYIEKELNNIPVADVKISNEKNYPTALIIGPTHYLSKIQGHLKDKFSVDFKPSEPVSYNLVDGLRILLRDEMSNLGWRIVAEHTQDPSLLKKQVQATQDGTPLVEIIPTDTVDNYKTVIQIVKKIIDDNLLEEDLKILSQIVPEQVQEIVDFFRPTTIEEDSVQKDDALETTVLMTSYVGSKGLSAEHVFIVGAHNGSLPKNPRKVSDVEVSQFVVALTRTRKRCHIISNRWFIAPIMNGKRQPKNEPSLFVEWLPSTYLKNLGYLKAGDI